MERWPLFITEVKMAVDRINTLCGERRWRDGWVYAIKQSGRSSLIKIGKANDPVKRLTDIQAMNASALVLVGLSHGACIEGDLHWQYRMARAHGEWFDIDSNPLLETASMCFGCAHEMTATDARLIA